MKEILKDLSRCFKLSLKIILIPIILGAIIGILGGLINGGLNPEGILRSIDTTCIRISCFGLAISAVGFIKPDMMGPLNYQEEWIEYFSRFNIVGVIFFISLFMLTFSIIIDLVVFNIY